MADYIRRDDAVKIAEKYGLANGSVLGRHTGLADCIASEISSLPAADVAEVVRCKDCRHSKYAAWCEGYACCRTVGEYHHADFGCTAGNCEQTELQNERTAV